MQAGQLKTKIRIQKQITTGTGSFALKTWVDVIEPTEENPNCYIYSSWVNVHGSEAWVADSVQAQMGATVTIRYRSDVVPSYRILKGNVAYQIVSLDNIREENHWLEIKVKASVIG